MRRRGGALRRRFAAPRLRRSCNFSMASLKQFRQLLLATPEWLSESFRRAEARRHRRTPRRRGGSPSPPPRPPGRWPHMSH